MVAGRLIENTRAARRSACDLSSRLEARRSAAPRNRIMNASRAGGVAGSVSELEQGGYKR